MIVARILSALHLRGYDPEARETRLKRVEELETVTRILRGQEVLAADDDAARFMRRGRHRGGN